MDHARRLLAATAIGAGYGGSVSAVNDLSSAYGDLGRSLAGTRLQSALEVVSTMTGAGWAWAALAVAVGWYLRTRRWGAAAGALALTAATATYYALDEVLRAEPVLDSDIRWWCAAGAVLGLLLGTVGARARRPDLLGLLARLIVPVGAAVQMVVLPPGAPGIGATVEDEWARGLVWLLSAVAGVCILAWYRRRAREHGSAGSQSS